jgi:hypothetical protein
MKLWKIITAHLVIISLVGCTSTAKMTALDRSLVNKKITRTATGGVQIDMDGNFILNPTAAIETFHTVAEKEMGGRPYHYTYTVDKKQTTRQIPGNNSSATSSSSGGSYYTPIYVPAGGGGGGGGEAAIILGSIALIILIAKMASSSREEKAPQAQPAPASTPTPAAEPVAPREEVVTTRILRVSGTAEPVAPVSLDRNRLVEVLLPDESPVIGKLKPAVAKALSEEIRRGFESMGCQVLLGSQSRQSGYTVRTSVLRSQGNAIIYSNLTVEITLVDQKTGRELARWIVQATEKPFDLKSQNERLYGAGIATGILQKPLKTQMSRYLR